jgi:AcrR family transcriptional regulator
MPKRRDSKLESRILDAAYKLWVHGGERALTMRAVATASGTTTPTLYERFRDKRDLLAALRARAQQKLLEAIKPTRTLAEASQVALGFAIAHPHEYELVAKDWAARLSHNEPAPTFDLLKVRLAEELGGSPEDYVEQALRFALLHHGASMLLLQEGIQPRTAAAIRRAYNSATEALIQDALHRAETPKHAAD